MKSINPSLRIGETVRANNGMLMTIIAYRGCNDIDIQFEDETVLTNKRYDLFKSGSIANPNYKPHIGETAIATNGLKMTLVDYRSNTDVDVEFEDGEMQYHVSYRNFQKGQVVHPKIPNAVLYKNAKKYIGKTNVATNGLPIFIKDYRNSDDIDVSFDDGATVKTTLQAFLMGTVAHPDIDTRLLQMSNKYINRMKRMSCGLSCRIVNYRNSHDIDVLFENGILRKHMDCGAFNKGNIALPSQIGEVLIKEFAYIYDNEWYYVCYHVGWEGFRILSVKEMENYEEE